MHADSLIEQKKIILKSILSGIIKALFSMEKTVVQSNTTHRHTQMITRVTRILQFSPDGSSL